MSSPDVNFLRNLSTSVLPDHYDRLQAIASKLEKMTAAAASQDELEQRVEAQLAEAAEAWANDTESTETLEAALWLIQRRLVQR